MCVCFVDFWSGKIKVKHFVFVSREVPIGVRVEGVVSVICDIGRLSNNEIGKRRRLAATLLL